MDLTNLTEQLITIISEKRFSAGLDLLEMRHLIGKEITDNELYKKHSKGRGKLIQELAESIEWSERSLRYCVEFNEKFPSFKEFISTFDSDHKLPAWREVVKSLPSGVKDKGKEENPAIVFECKKCPLHC